jgi:hypothetical protein
MKKSLMMGGADPCKLPQRYVVLGNTTTALRILSLMVQEKGGKGGGGGLSCGLLGPDAAQAA